MRSRPARLAGKAFRLTLYAIVGVLAVRFFADSLLSEGWTPRTFFALLLLTGAVSLVWRAALDVAKIAKKLR